MESTHLEGRAAVVGAAASGSWPVGPYMLADFVDDLPLQTPEIVDVDITCLEAQEENLYIGTSAHEILHFVLLPPSVPSTPQPVSALPPPFPSQKLSYILASRIQPPRAVSQLHRPYIKAILLLPGPSKILVLSSTGLLSFWSYPELSPAYDGNVKLGGTNFVGALDLDDVDREEGEVMGLRGYAPENGSGRRSSRSVVDNSKMVLVMGKKGVKIVKVKGDEPRLVKTFECPALVYGARRGPIACVATNTDYSLLHLEIGGIIPLFPILSSSAPASSLPEEDPPPKPPRPPLKSPSPGTSEKSDSEASNLGEPSGRRASSSTTSRPHLSRGSSLQQRPRSEVLSSTRQRLGVEDDSASGKHTRASSTGSIRGRAGGSIGRNSLLSRSRGGSVGRATGKDASREIITGRAGTPSPTPSPGGSLRGNLPGVQASPKLPPLHVPPVSGPRSTTSSRNPTPNPTPPGSATSSHPKPRSSKPPSPAPKSPSPKPQPSTQITLRPHIVSPSPNEFLLITGTSPTDPGVGMFVNNDGDPTRGTISFSKYPEEIVLEEGCIIALLPALEGDSGMRVLEMICILDSESGISSTGGFIEVNTSRKAGISRVTGLDEVATSEVGNRLRFERVRLLTTQSISDSQEVEEWEIKRNAEELEAANRISRITGRVVLFSGKRIWRLLPSPMVIRLDSKLPPPVLLNAERSPEARKEADKRRANILSVLKEVHGLEPTTERMFHEIAYIKQKCGVLLLAEFLSLPREEDKRQFPTELLATERALIEGSLDPRVVVSLFGGFEEELREGRSGVWVYGGIREMIDVLLNDRRSQKQPGEGNSDLDESQWDGRRDLLLLLRRYLSAWRQKKGFGSVSQEDEKEIFWTIDAALLRCLLTLEATRSPSALQHMAGEVDVRAELYKMVDYPSSVECFDRCVYLLETFKRLYVLSILYQSRKMSREVLETWRRILEAGDDKIMAEFGEGENKIAEYLLGKKDKELVKEYGLWLAKRNHKLGIKVFTDERSRVKWTVEEVLEMVREHAPDTLRTYVEYLVMEKKNYAYSNDLLLIYLNTLTSTLSSPSETTTDLQSSYEAYRALSLPKPTYRKFLEDNILPANDGADWWSQRLTFLELLASASEMGVGYDDSVIMEKLEAYSHLLIPEMIVLYGRASDHEKALNLLVHELRDFDGSVIYCIHVGKSGLSSEDGKKGKNLKAGKGSKIREEQERLFGLLFVEALNLKDWIVRQEWTEMLLERWGGWLDAVHVLSVIPDSYSIALISNFLIGALRTLVREKNESVITKAIRRGENLRVNADFVDKCDELGPTIQADEEPAFL